MDNNKRFFIYTTLTGTLVTGKGVVNYNVDLRRIIGSLWDKYEAFNISIEGFNPEGGNYSGNNRNASCVHLTGLPFMSNYYDSLQQYSTSRVLELVLWDLGGWNFMKNVNKVAFYRPTTRIIPEWTTFLTNPAGGFDEYYGTNNYHLMFCITGIDAYRIRRIPKPLVYRGFNKPNPMLTLNTSYATSIDPIDVTATKKRIFRFDNVNWRTIIGNELYDKYEKFALVTRYMSNVALNNTFGAGFPTFPIYLSGSNLIFENNFDPFMWSNNQVVGLHGNMPVCVACLRYGWAKDFYVENVFLKPFQDIGTLTLHFSALREQSLATGNNGPTTSNNVLYPTLYIQFEIIPVVDVLA